MLNCVPSALSQNQFFLVSREENHSHTALPEPTLLSRSMCAVRLWPLSGLCCLLLLVLFILSQDKKTCLCTCCSICLNFSSPLLEGQASLAPIAVPESSKGLLWDRTYPVLDLSCLSSYRLPCIYSCLRVPTFSTYQLICLPESFGSAEAEPCLVCSQACP